MKFKQDLQYGILFGLYLARAGRATTEDTAEELGLSRSLLEQVAAKLNKAGILRSVKGPSGGHELSGEPTIIEFVNALQPIKLVKYDTHTKQEFRALHRLSSKLTISLHLNLSKTVREVMQELINEEVKEFKKLDAKGVLNQ